MTNTRDNKKSLLRFDFPSLFCPYLRNVGAWQVDTWYEDSHYRQHNHDTHNMVLFSFLSDFTMKKWTREKSVQTMKILAKCFRFRWIGASSTNVYFLQICFAWFYHKLSFHILFSKKFFSDLLSFFPPTSQKKKKKKKGDIYLSRKRNRSVAVLPMRSYFNQNVIIIYSYLEMWYNVIIFSWLHLTSKMWCERYVWLIASHLHVNFEKCKLTLIWRCDAIFVIFD